MRSILPFVDVGVTALMVVARCYDTAADGDLLAWSADGDQRAFDQLVLRYAPYALRIAARLMGDAALAEDIAQEAMIRAWTHVGRFDARRGLFTTWLFRIVTNLCIDQRRRRRIVTLPAEIELVDSAMNAHEMLEVSQRRTKLLQALDDLPEKSRAALTLVYDEGLSGAETARVMGMSPKAVERLLARTRTKLRERLDDSDGSKGSV